MLFAVYILALVALATSEKVTFENYKVFRIVPSTIKQLEVLKHIEDVYKGYSYWTNPSFVYRPVDLMVAPGQLAAFTELMNLTNTKYEMFIDNVQRLIDGEMQTTRSESFDWTSYHTLEEIYSWLDSLSVKYPNNVTVVVAGRTYQNRLIKGVKLSFGPNKSGIFIEGGIHAREWISPATVTYILDQLLHSSEPEIRNLAESYDWYLFPSFNPDGYVYTHTTNRLWRKTLSRNSLFCSGTDANRNWDFKWMSAGASKNPCAETYAGRSAFSEVETKSLSAYLQSIKDHLFAYISFHSYSQLLLFPYGHTSEHLDNYKEAHAIGVATINALAKRYGTKYVTGNIAETIYPASGSSMDWVKATLRLPVSFTYELRDTGKYGFILPAEQIIPNGQEILDSLVVMFTEAKKFGYPKDIE
ncbi:PREDICTED: zinc carboxypeptidase-like [Ceratosolen solmsi marchali]|uniref:Zinc carboxypeptidase A 1 n=1 Tax=Ceratosolen solmsi marchali TaxID=326594 RepID=A0AAJ6YHI7_9HYME|nr:PREDICTED: zinc carboxypeptidase-like [Ceratosolen solmsi marchali]